MTVAELAGICVCWAMVGAPEKTPAPAYEARVPRQTYAMSGPGIGYYPTAILVAGQKVTVVGERQGNWVAIHPPEGSFSYVPARSIEEQPDGSGKVVADGTQARVGSNLSDAHHVFQATLTKGAAVRILDKLTLDDDGQSALWYKILPPANEVRYLLANQLEAPTTPAIEAAPPAEPKAPAKPAAEPKRQPAALQTVGAQAIPAARPLMRNVVSRSPNSSASTPAAVPIADDPKAPFDQRLKNLQAQLELMSARDPATWAVDQAQQIVTQWREETKEAAQQQKLAELLARVRRLADLRQRYLKLVRAREMALERDRELAALQQRKQEKLRPVEPRFTAEGQLVETAKRIAYQPTYALQDDKGIVTHYLLAAPGLDLSRYLGVRAGLVGEIEQRPEVPLPVLTVRQLTPL